MNIDFISFVAGVFSGVVVGSILTVVIITAVEDWAKQPRNERREANANDPLLNKPRAGTEYVKEAERGTSKTVH